MSSATAGACSVVNSRGGAAGFSARAGSTGTGRAGRLRIDGSNTGLGSIRTRYSSTTFLVIPAQSARSVSTLSSHQMRRQKTCNREADTVLGQRDEQLREANRNIRDMDARCDRAFAQMKPLDAVVKRALVTELERDLVAR